MFAKLYSAVYVWHRPGAPLDPLRAVGAVQAGAAVGAEVVAGPYVDHRVSAHGALLFLASSHPPCAGIRSILLMPAGTVPAAAVLIRRNSRKFFASLSAGRGCFPEQPLVHMISLTRSYFLIPVHVAHDPEGLHPADCVLHIDPDLGLRFFLFRGEFLAWRLMGSTTHGSSIP